MIQPATTAVERSQVRDLVHAFYADVQADALLGPLFARSMHRNWPDHLALMTDFWCTAFKLDRSFRGNVYGRHVALAGVTRDHLLRWLRLWRKHTSQNLPRAEAERALGVAVGMARVLHLGWFETLPTRQALCAAVDAMVSAEAPALPAEA